MNMKTPNGQFNNIEQKNKYFINTPGNNENSLGKTDTQIEPQLPKESKDLENRLKELDYKYHCNSCPYFCFYKLYYSKTEKKIYISIHCESNSFHKEDLSLEDFLNRKETKFIKMLNVCELCKSPRKNSEDYFLCTNCNFAICINCEKDHSHHQQSLININDIFKNICYSLLMKCWNIFILKVKKNHQLYEITQNLYNIVKFTHLQMPNDLNFNSLNNFIVSRGSFIIIMEKKA